MGVCIPIGRQVARALVVGYFRRAQLPGDLISQLAKNLFNGSDALMQGGGVDTTFLNGPDGL